jgi:hypothetical protein
MEKEMIYHLICGLSGILSVGLLIVVLLTTDCALLQALVAVSIAAISCLTMRGHEIIDETEEDK